MFETKEKWDTDRFWLEWRKLPNRNKFTINNHDFKVYSGSTNLELSCLRCKKSFEITVRRFFEWKKCILCHPQYEKKASLGELHITKYLKDKRISFIPQARFPTCRNINPLPFDFYLDDFGILIEFQGGHHYFPHSYSSDKSQETKDKNLEGVQERDKIKKQWAIDNGFVLLEITYADLDNLQELLFKEMHIASA